MWGLVQLWNEWEIQLLVLLSLTIQMFLFFTGSLRLRNTNMLVRFVIWMAYLGADLVAVYALGFLSRHESATMERDTSKWAHQLTFFWTPFLLIHLGGQDTITAFAIEDNALWLRHLLNLVIQVILALYIFWKTTGAHNVELLVPAILSFVAGIIKYGERTMALFYGNLKDLSGSISNENEKGLFSEPTYYWHFKKKFVSFALHSAPSIRDLFAGCTLHQMEDSHREIMTSNFVEESFPKSLEIELALMYDDLYTKAMVLRKMSGIILRGISQISTIVAFVLFILSNKFRYNRVDVAITYVLFIGGFILEVCAVFMAMASPWTWAWLEARKYHRLARMSWFLLSSCLGWPENRKLWSNSMGQYNILSYVGYGGGLSRRVMTIMRKVSSVVRIRKEKLLWISKSLDTKYIKVDKEIMMCLERGVHQYKLQGPRDDPLLKRIVPDFGASFAYGVVCFHIFTEFHLSKYSPATVLIGVCRKLSNYMVYLLVTHPSMLPVSGSATAPLKFFLDQLEKIDSNTGKDGILLAAGTLLKDLLKLEEQQPLEATPEKLRDMWIRLLLYAAGKSRPEMHAAQLGRGGELLTFAWLLMAHNELGDVSDRYGFFLPEQPIYSFFGPHQPSSPSFGLIWGEREDIIHGPHLPDSPNYW